MSTLAGARVAEIVVHHHARQFVHSKYGISRAWRVALDLFLVKMLTGFAARPTLWFGILSIPSLCLGTTCLVGVGILESARMIISTLALLSFALSGHLIAIGVLGEMILKVGDFRPERMLGEANKS
jgi:hypothetical protein